MNFKYLYIITMVICCSFNLSAIDTLQFEKYYQHYIFQEELVHFTDSSNKLTLTEVQDKAFTKKVFPEFFPIQHTYWAAFYLEQDTTVEYELFYPMVDSITFFFPNKDGTYQEVLRGTYTETKIDIGSYDAIYISTNTLDFSKPVYFRVRNFSKWGANLNFERLISIMKMPKGMTILHDRNLDRMEMLFIIFLAISGFLCLYFLIQFLINKKQSFFLYSCYLITLFIYFLNRLQPMLFWTIFNEPTVMGLVNENAQILSSVTYLAFINKFLNFKENYPKFHKYLIGSIFLILFIMLIYSCLYCFFPFNPIHLNMMTIFRVINTIVSLAFIIIIIRKQPKTLEWIVIVSGIILMLAAVIPPILGNLSYSIPFILAEILLLAIGLAYQVRLNDLERIKTKENLIKQLELNVTIQKEMQEKLEQEVTLQTQKAIQKTQEAEQAKAEQLKSTFEREMEQIKMKALQAQMNPHFLFNCLNSIRLFYLKNETKKADNYITKFSRLLRMMLNNSRANLISLQEELNALKLYVEFEQMRFKDKFDFELTIDKQVNTQELKVQPLTIQPFVENAIWHGLMQSDKKGKLNILIKLKEEKTVITIEDNGIGRAKAKALKAGQHQIHKSHGLNITKERMDLMKKSLNRQADFKIIDLQNTQNEAIGTRVEIIYS
ncbi:MAG: histidine kinase [Saprospiraceae bacterium]